MKKKLEYKDYPITIRDLIDIELQFLKTLPTLSKREKRKYPILMEPLARLFCFINRKLLYGWRG